MSDKTGIEWADATWNPLVGCTKVSPGCDHCYAETLVNRFAGTSAAFPTEFHIVNVRSDKFLTQPLRWKTPRLIFVNSLSDLFHQDVADEFVARVFAVMAKCPQHTFQVLTKRHARMRSLLSSPWMRDQVAAVADLDVMTWPLPNVWLGVSAETQQWADIRIPALLETPAAVRFVSAEPLLGPITLPAVERLDWVIVGGESGPGARPMHADWARGLRDQCVGAGVPFLFKQWGEWAPTRVDDPLRPSAVFVNVAPPGEPPLTMCRVGKKAAGRLLDGCTWDEYPLIPERGSGFAALGVEE